MQLKDHLLVRYPQDTRQTTLSKSGQTLLICNKDLDSAPTLAQLGKAKLYVTEVLDRQHLSDVVSRVSPAAVLISTELLRSLLGESCSHPESVEDLEHALLGLRPRDAEVVRMLAKGLHNQEIASSLKISVRLVKSILSALYLRHDVTNRTELLGQLMEEGHSKSRTDLSISRVRAAVGTHSRSNAFQRVAFGKPA